VTEIPLAEPAVRPPTNAYEVVAGTYTVRMEHDTSLLVLSVPEMTFEAGVSYDLLLLPTPAA
jgi:hypothetical protein